MYPRLAAWIQASRPLAAVQMLAPLGFGMALAWATQGRFRGGIAWLLVAFTLLDQLVIVFANDVADLRTDLENRTHNRFSGGSRVIAEGKLTPLDLGRGALVSLLALGGVSAYLALVELRAFMVVLAAIAAHLLWMYSFPPFRLSYRGHGEVLQALGLGAVLPLVGYYGQTGDVEGLAPSALAGPLLLGWAGNVLTALPDRPSDEAAGKRSLAVRRGEPAARRAALLALALAVAATPLATPGAAPLAQGAAALGGAVVLARATRLAPAADSADHAGCERFVFWGGATSLALLVGWSLALLTARA